MTITIQIGNSDDKLSQKRWSDFCHDTQIVISHYAKEIHFTGHSPGWERWQNACWVCVLTPDNIELCKAALLLIRDRYAQESIAWTEGETEFLGAT